LLIANDGDAELTNQRNGSDSVDLRIHGMISIRPDGSRLLAKSRRSWMQQV
jgi:hypothetical protein